ncbi:hypothetical protein TNCV_2872141 [Trichonephila clavipes]|nr:hypothetical protein TNCV_2872141 [Trichonephila clavipes]
MVGQKTRDLGNSKGQSTLNARGQGRLRCIVRSHRTHRLSQTTSQLNDGASRTVSKSPVQRSLHSMSFRIRHPTRERVPLLNTRLHVFPGQGGTETGVKRTGNERHRGMSLDFDYSTPTGG